MRSPVQSTGRSSLYNYYNNNNFRVNQSENDKKPPEVKAEPPSQQQQQQQQPPPDETTAVKCEAKSLLVKVEPAEVVAARPQSLTQLSSQPVVGLAHPKEEDYDSSATVSSLEGLLDDDGGF